MDKKGPPQTYDVAKMIFPCHGVCGRMTRPSRWPAEKFPDTIIRATGIYCHACRDKLGLNPARARKPKPAPEATENIIAGLEAWTRRRRADAQKVTNRRYQRSA